MPPDPKALLATPDGVLTVSEPSDDEPWRLAAQSLAAGNGGALDALWDLSGRDLYGLALWRSGSVADAEDAVQEVFLRLARAPQTLTRAERPRAYLLAMAHRAATDLMRKRGRRGLDPDASLVGPTADPARHVDAQRASDLVRALPPKQRAVVFLKHFAGLTFAEIGHVTGVPTFTAASRYRLALRRLRKRMGVEP